VWEEQVPSVGRISWVDAGQDGKEVRLEGADGTLSGIAPVHVWRDKLVCAAPCVGDVVAVVYTGFIVKDDSVNIKVAGMEARHDGAGGRNAVAVVFGGKWLDEYCVAGMVVCNHYVLVAALGLDGEAPGVVGVEAMKRKLAEVQLRRWQLLGRWWFEGRKSLPWSGRLCGAHMLSCLELVAFDGGVGARAVACS
jgi:hypothetical protein